MGVAIRRGTRIASFLMAGLLLLAACDGGSPGSVASGSRQPAASGGGQPSPAPSVDRDARAVVRIGGEPVDVVAGFGSMWVIDNANGSVARVSPQTNAVTARIALPDAHPGGLTVAADGMWVIDDRDPHAWRIDAATDRPTRLDAGDAMGAAPAVLAGGLWVTRFDGLARIDLRTGVVQPIRLRVEPSGDEGCQGYCGVAVAGGDAWVANGDGTVLRVDAKSHRIVATVRVGGTPWFQGPSTGFGSVWAANLTSGTVARLDVRTNRVTAVIAVGRQPFLSVGRDAVWVANSLDGTVMRIDPDTNAVTRTIPVGRAPEGLGEGFGSIWVANSGDGTVSRIDPSG